MLNLKKLFGNEKWTHLRNIKEIEKMEDPMMDVAKVKTSSDSEFFETAIMILVIIFLLDSRI